MKLLSALPASTRGRNEETSDSELPIHTTRLCTGGWDLEKTTPLLLETVLLELEQHLQAMRVGRTPVTVGDSYDCRDLRGKWSLSQNLKV